MPEETSIRIQLKRAYEAPATADGLRILVDRVWPRGMTKKALRIDEWAKDLAPSTELRKWFDHDPAKWLEFQDRYGKELDQQPEAISSLLEKCQAHSVTLVFGAKNVDNNNAVSLRDYLLRKYRQRRENR